MLLFNVQTNDYEKHASRLLLSIWLHTHPCNIWGHLDILASDGGVQTSRWHFVRLGWNIKAIYGSSLTGCHYSAKLAKICSMANHVRHETLPNGVVPRTPYTAEKKSDGEEQNTPMIWCRQNLRFGFQSTLGFCSNWINDVLPIQSPTDRALSLVACSKFLCFAWIFSFSSGRHHSNLEGRA
jgi:hypothetical protein